MFHAYKFFLVNCFRSLPFQKAVKQSISKAVWLKQEIVFIELKKKEWKEYKIRIKNNHLGFFFVIYSE